MNYLLWHYTRGFLNVLKTLINLEYFVFHFFSIKLLFRTLFSPFERLGESYSKKLDLGATFATLIVNTIMRFVGFLVRGFTIILGLVCSVLASFFCLAFIFLWLLLPLIFLGILGLGFWQIMRADLVSSIFYLSFDILLSFCLIKLKNLSDRANPLYESKEANGKSLYSIPEVKSALLRLGITNKIILPKAPKLKAKDILDLASRTYDATPELRTLLLSYEVSKEDFIGSIDLEIRSSKRRLERSCVLSKKRLSLIPSIGVNWSYGKISILEKFATELFEGIEELPRYKRYLEALESSFQKQKQANAIIIAPTEDMSLEIMNAYVGRIRRGEVSHEIEYKRIFLLDTGLLSGLQSRDAFEQVFREVVSESIKVGNIILVLPHIGELVERGRVLGLDTLMLIDAVLNVSNVHVVALSDLGHFHRSIETDKVFMERVEKIIVEDFSINDLRDELYSLIRPIESLYHVFFTYQALKSAQKTVEQFYPERLYDAYKDVLEGVAIEFSKGVIGAKEMSKYLAEKTGVALAEDKEADLLLNLENHLRERIIGQDEALKVVADALRRIKTGLVTHHRPMASFLFLGPTGVGKTETAKVLAATYFGDENKIIRFDMSEYSGSDALWKLSGSLATAEPGLLAKGAREKVHGVLLLDEIEKSHQSAKDLFLQILDEGFFTDAYGEKVNMRNFIIVATSNAEGRDMPSLLSGNVFRPEFLNRFDAVVFFNKLDESNNKDIIRIQLRLLVKNLYKDKSLEVSYEESLVDVLAKELEGSTFGARPIQRLIQDKISQVIAKDILGGKASPGTRLKLALMEDGKTVYTIYN